MREAAVGAETVLGRQLVTWLREDGWDVHQEVEWRGPRADIVAWRAPLLHIIELKVSLTFDLLAQAEHWRRQACAHLVSIAVPRTQNARGGREVARRTCRWLGVGILELDRHGGITPVLAPALQRHAKNAAELQARLCEGTRTFADAGNALGRHWYGHVSPFKTTCRALVDVLRDAGGPVSVREAIALLKGRHHYASDAGALRTLVARCRDNLVEGVVLEQRGADGLFFRAA